jgi:hypothetical protein
MFIDAGNRDYRLGAASLCLNAAADGYNMGAYLGTWQEPPNPDTLMNTILKQNRPNPFHNNTFISYRIHTKKSTEDVSLQVFNNRGQLVRTLISEPKSNGQYVVFWNGLNDAGQALSSGFYFGVLRVSGVFVGSIKMAWLRPIVKQP